MHLLLTTAPITGGLAMVTCSEEGDKKDSSSDYRAFFAYVTNSTQITVRVCNKYVKYLQEIYGYRSL